MRIALGIQYDGNRYHGWQKQPDLSTVQGHLEHALSKIANDAVSVVCAGRTDTGVHAIYQVIHFDCQVARDERAWVFGTNANLPQDIVVLWAKEVSDEFDARFSARSRQYHYFIHNTPVRSALLNRKVVWYYQSLDAELMHTAAQVLVGEHDFSAFRAVGCQSNSPNRHIQAISVTRDEQVICLKVQADSFLYHMVRNIAGVLISVGSGKKDASYVQTVLDSRDRAQGGVTAPPYGLYLSAVNYPDEFELPAPDSKALVLLQQ